MRSTLAFDDTSRLILLFYMFWRRNHTIMQGKQSICLFGGSPGPPRGRLPTEPAAPAEGQLGPRSLFLGPSIIYKYTLH